MIPHFTLDVDIVEDRTTVTARSGDKKSAYTVVKDRGVYRVVEHGAGFSLARPAVAYATRLAVEDVL